MELFRLLRKVVGSVLLVQSIYRNRNMENEWNEFEQIFGEKSVFYVVTRGICLG